MSQAIYPAGHQPFVQIESRCRSVRMADKTGPLEILRGRRVIIIADVQNLDCGARDLGCRLTWATLGELLSNAAAWASLHAVFARPAGDSSCCDRFKSCAWIPHAKTMRRLSRSSGIRFDSNADNQIAFVAGLLAALIAADLVILGTGDGTLAQDIAEAIGQLPKPLPVATLSLAGSTAHRLNAKRCPLIAANMEVGLDSMERLRAVTRHTSGSGYPRDRTRHNKRP